MAGSPVDTGGVSKLVGQLRSASNTGERNMATVEELLAALEQMKEQVESGHDSLRSDLDELVATCSRDGEAAESAIRGLEGAASEGSTSQSEAAATVGQATAAAESSHSGEADRLSSLTETITEQGFGEVTTALSGIIADEEGAGGALASAFADLESEGADLQSGWTAAGSMAAERMEAAVSGIQSETQPGMEAAGEAAAAELDSLATNGEQDAAQMSGQLQEAYSQWSGEQEQEQDRLRTAVTEVTEATVGVVLEAAMEALDSPCSGILEGHAPAVLSELQGVAGMVEEWVQACGELANAAGELDRGHDAKRRLDALFEGGG